MNSQRCILLLLFFSWPLHKTKVDSVKYQNQLSSVIYGIDQQRRLEHALAYFKIHLTAGCIKLVKVGLWQTLRASHLDRV